MAAMMFLSVAPVTWVRSIRIDEGDRHFYVAPERRSLIAGFLIEPKVDRSLR
jgi:hypothetical protein